MFTNKKTKLRGFSPQANYTDRAIACLNFSANMIVGQAKGLTFKTLSSSNRRREGQTFCFIKRTILISIKET
jgi:hypothetical protein